MGWTSGDGGRRRVVGQQKMPWKTVSGKTVTPIKHHAAPGEDWFLVEIRDQSGVGVDTVITVTIWDGDAHKEMDESVGPYYWRCPVSWLKLAPEKNADWRRQVRLVNEVAA